MSPRIALDCRSLQDGSRSRGIGNVVRFLIPELALRLPNLVLFTDSTQREIESFNLPIIAWNPKAPLADFLTQHQVAHIHFMAQYNVPLNLDFSYSVTVHDLFNEYLFINSQKDLIQQQKTVAPLRAAKWLFAVSQYTRSELITRHHFSPHSIIVTYPGHSPHLGKIHQESPNLEPEYSVPYILTLGNFQTRKNQLNMIKATIALNRNRAQKIHYIAVQTDGYWTAKMVGLFHILLAGQIRYFHFLGWVSDLQLTALFKYAKLFSFVSKAEGFGIPVLEAMAFDIPILAGNATAMPEVGQDGVEYANPDSINDIRQKMAECLEHPTISPELKRKRNAILNQFTYAKMADLMTERFNF